MTIKSEMASLTVLLYVTFQKQQSIAVGNLTGQGEMWQKWTRMDYNHNKIMFSDKNSYILT